jgi:hypothetical protein
MIRKAERYRTRAFPFEVLTSPMIERTQPKPMTVALA